MTLLSNPTFVKILNQEKRAFKNVCLIQLIDQNVVQNSSRSFKNVQLVQRLSKLKNLTSEQIFHSGVCGYQ